MRYQCPVCGYPKLPYPPRDYHICPCCGTEFGNDDAELSHAQIREMWIASGAQWFFRTPPDYWNPYLQLIKAGLVSFVPEFTSSVYFLADGALVSKSVQTNNDQIPHLARVA
jgi:hypothetical protein